MVLTERPPARDGELSMELEQSGLSRFKLDGPLGEGADCQVFAATDLEDGVPVVVKRPHPMLIVHGQHADVQRRLSLSLELQRAMSSASSPLAGAVAYATVEPGFAYFGDTHDHPYLVVVEERARGLPLVGSAADGIKRNPIGLPQRLFALHPVVRHFAWPRFSVARDVLEIGCTFLDQGIVLLDARPQNVFFDPRNSRIKLIDTGGATKARPATRRRPALDAHDFYLELFKWYLPMDNPPSTPEGYTAPHGMDSVPRFEQDLAALRRTYETTPWRVIGESGGAIVERVRERGYSSPSEFREHFLRLVGQYEARYDTLASDPARVAVWTEARQLLALPYWRKYLFDPAEDLVAYRAGESS